IYLSALSEKAFLDRALRELARTTSYLRTRWLFYLHSLAELDRAQPYFRGAEARRSENIVISDDEPSLLRAISRLLRGDWTVTPCETSEATIERLRHEPGGALITDQNRPGLLGSEMLATILSERATHLPATV